MTEDLATKDLKKRVGKIGFIVLVAILILSGSVLFALVKNGISVYAVSGDSMEPTFSDKDSLVISQKKDVDYDQVVFFTKPAKWSRYADNDITLVKRMTALPGDVLEYDGKVFTVNGEVVYDVEKENYDCSAGEVGYKHVLTNKEIFVTGDNAAVSLDSRRVFCDGDSEDMFVPRQVIKNYGEVVFQF